MARNNSRNTRDRENALFKRLTRLFSGPLVNRKTQLYQQEKRRRLDKYNFKSASGKGFKKTEYNPFENLQSQAMANQNRAERYADFDSMEFLPEINSGLDLYADEITTATSLEQMLKIDCPNEEIKAVLKNLYFNILNVEYNLFGWSRTMCKYGDFFLYLDVDEADGITNVIGLPSQEVERLEGEDPTNPNYVQFQWNSGGMTFENWQIGHFRILGNDKYAPYGQSVLEPCRRIFRQLTLLEDAMMAYRVVRSAERRVFYIDIGNIDPSDVEQYMQKVITTLKKNQIVDSTTGRVDLRYNPLCHFPNDYAYLCDGTRKTFKELSETEDEDVYIWSLDENHNVVPTKMLWCGKTLDNAEFIEVELDDGQVIKTTPEHKWLLRDGTKIQAKELVEGQSLMPFYSKIERKLTQRRGNKKNFYVNIYHPGKDKYETGHKITAECKYGGPYKYPNVIHHINHVKYNNSPLNLQKMTNVEHGILHERLSQKLKEYAQSPAGRQRSREVLAKVRRDYDCSLMAKNLWLNKDIRAKRVDALTLNIDTKLIYFTLQALNHLGTEVREYEIRDWLNNDQSFVDYLSSMNEDFKNGFNDRLTRMQFLKCLRKVNFQNVRAVKDFYVATKAPWDKVVQACEKVKSRKEITKIFGISKYDLTRLIESHGLTKQEFDERFLNGGYYNAQKIVNCLTCDEPVASNNRIKEERKYCSHKCYWESLRLPENKLNHKIVSVRKYSEKSDAYGLTVENSTHIIAVGGENAPLLGGKVPGSGVFMTQSLEEDYFLPVHGNNTSTKIETLPGASYTGDIDDVKYLRDKLFTALKIPQAYLTSDDSSDDKSTLAQKDIRFARTIQRLQRSLIAELEKIGMIHLYTLGFRGDDLLSHNLSLNNPSKIAELQELEHWRTKFDVASAATDGFFSKRWVAKKIFGLTDEEFMRNQREMFYDRKFEAALEIEGELLEGELSGLATGPLDDDIGGDSGEIDLGLDDEDAEEGGDLDFDLGDEDDSMDTGDDETLLAAPGKRDDKRMTTTPRSKGKAYLPVKHRGGDRRNAGARKRSTLSKAAHEKGGSSRRNIFGGASGLFSAASGIFEEYESSYEGEISLIEEGEKKSLERYKLEESKLLKRDENLKNLLSDLETSGISKDGFSKVQRLTEQDIKKMGVLKSED